MEIYLVGGAVRDRLLGRTVKEKDWVVVGATPEDMLTRGFKPVGKDFPVFLHPDTNEEYALARTERKTGKGYKGFVFNADPSVTLEEDLVRRDLTINAMAQTENGSIIDPFNGQKDLQQKLLRHVSDAFAEDPVRILRIARFASRFPDFNIHPDTYQLMQTMVNNGEVDALVPERVWKECYRALDEPAPWRFFETLAECNALPIIFPEIKSHNIAALKAVVPMSEDGPTRFAALLCSLTLDAVKKLCKRITAPKEYQEIAQLAATYHELLANLEIENAEQIVHLLEILDCYRRPYRLAKFLIACAANNEKIDQNNLNDVLNDALERTKHIDVKPFIEQGLKNEKIGEAVREARIKRLK